MSLNYIILDVTSDILRKSIILGYFLGPNHDYYFNSNRQKYYEKHIFMKQKRWYIHVIPSLPSVIVIVHNGVK